MNIDLPEGLDAAVLHERGSSTTIVWFGGLFEPFPSTRVLEECGANGLFLRDANSDWYTGGVSGLTRDMEETARWLRPLVEAPGAVTVFAGQSSGGYAALRLAHGLAPNLCIAFAPQTGNRRNFVGGVSPWVPLDMVDAVFRDDPKDHVPIVIHVSRSERADEPAKRWRDWAHVGPMRRMKNVTVVDHPYDRHPVALYLSGKGLLHRTIRADIELYARPV